MEIISAYVANGRQSHKCVCMHACAYMRACVCVRACVHAHVCTIICFIWCMCVSVLVLVYRVMDFVSIYFLTCMHRLFRGN